MNTEDDILGQAKFRDLIVQMFALMESRFNGGRLGDGRVVYVTSAVEGEGKSFVCQAMCYAAAEVLDGKVLLVDTNLNHPSVNDEFFIPPDSKGFSDRVVSDESSDDSFFEVLHNFHVLPAGTDNRPGLLYNREKIAQVLSDVADIYSLVIVDGASLNTIGANSIPYVADSLLLVVDSVSTQREVIMNALDDLAIESERYLGVVLNKKRRYIPKMFY